tara:strand:+ start:172 stop:510 length:339 start_codon:yes stop_codon:yes gene_type:complete
MDHSDYFAGYGDNGYKPIVYLDDWSMVPDRAGNPYMAPEMIRPLLHGKVSGHPLHEDGTYVTTSRILASAGREVETNNTVYRLGLMASGYKEWCSSNGVDVDPEHPVKMKTA